MLVVSSPEIAKEVMKTHDINFAQRPHLLATRIVTYDSTDIAFSPYGDYWRQLRKICVVELLSAKRVKSFQVIRKEEVSKLIRIINSSSRFPINLRDRISAFTYSAISRAALGKECKDHDPLTAALGEITKLASVRHKLEKVQQRIDGILQIVVDEHRERMKTTGGKLEEEKDLVDVLLKLQQDGDLELPLTDGNIKAVILVRHFRWGGDTVSTAVEWTMAEMMKNPEVMKKHKLRLHPPFPLLLPRECREKCKINGYEVPVKTRVVINAWAIGRGRRICPGILFGIPVIELPLAQLLFHFDWKLPNGMRPEDLDMTEVHGLAVRKKHNLHLIPIPYSPLTVG
ncbi:Premnaspirodiene oxygenase [Vitis vinifera]|uniref:Premnaspirodiene oxygenase n=1 Tax=Vitis vinifera TaxID=29760 RepID=A0A438DSD5_VITVI|nr:Premnaspirodiene oxygenase [Vitis vinifera]